MRLEQKTFYIIMEFVKELPINVEDYTNEQLWDIFVAKGIKNRDV